MSLTNGVTFGEYHSYKDWGLILMSVDFPNPEPKTEQIEIPGSSEVVDLSDIFGVVNYNQRKLTFRFKTFERFEKRFEMNGVIANLLHGRKLRIMLDDDKAHFFMGRVDFKTWKWKKGENILTFECICDPYRYDISDTSEDWLWSPFSFVSGIARAYKDIHVNGTYNLTIVGTNQIVYPTVTTNAPMTIEMDRKSVNVRAGVTKLYELPIPVGETIHVVTIKGNGIITFAYRGVTF